MSANASESKKNMLSNKEVRALIASSQEGNKKARDKLVENNVRLVWSVVQRVINRGYEPEDLFHIGSVRLIEAVDKLDLAYDLRCAKYAVQMSLGEIQRFIRDR